MKNNLTMFSADMLQSVNSKEEKDITLPIGGSRLYKIEVRNVTTSFLSINDPWETQGLTLDPLSDLKCFVGSLIVVPATQSKGISMVVTNSEFFTQDILTKDFKRQFEKGLLVFTDDKDFADMIFKKIYKNERITSELKNKRMAFSIDRGKIYIFTTGETEEVFYLSEYFPFLLNSI